MDEHDDGAGAVRAGLDLLVNSAPALGFGTADVVRAGRRRRRNRQVGAGVAALGVAASIVVPAMALSGTSTGGPVVAAAAGEPRVPGYSPTRLRELAVGCGRGAAPLATPPSTQRPSTPVPVAQLHTYNVIRDSAGGAALIYGPGVVVGCWFDGPDFTYLSFARMPPGMPDWLPGTVSIDAESGGSGSEARHIPAQEQLAGRVAQGVARVAVSNGPDHATLEPVNGTWLVRFVHRINRGHRLTDVRVRAYDAAGRLVGETTSMHPSACYLLPDGSYLDGVQPKPGERCRPATPWR